MNCRTFSQNHQKRGWSHQSEEKNGDQTKAIILDTEIDKYQHSLQATGRMRRSLRITISHCYCCLVSQDYATFSKRSEPALLPDQLALKAAGFPGSRPWFPAGDKSVWMCFLLLLFFCFLLFFVCKLMIVADVEEEGTNTPKLECYLCYLCR